MGYPDRWYIEVSPKGKACNPVYHLYDSADEAREALVLFRKNFKKFCKYYKTPPIFRKIKKNGGPIKITAVHSYRHEKTGKIFYYTKAS